MVYYKLILNDKRANASDSYPIEVRITFNRKNTLITGGIRVEKKDWNSACIFLTN
jgi:hypothetical protein